MPGLDIPKSEMKPQRQNLPTREIRNAKPSWPLEVQIQLQRRRKSRGINLKFREDINNQNSVKIKVNHFPQIQERNVMAASPVREG